MNATQLTPLADILVQSYNETAVYSRQFTADYGQPPTAIAKVQHLLAIAQSFVNKSDHYQLCPDYTELGKLQVVDVETGRTFLVRSNTAFGIEDARQQILFPDELAALATPIIMVIRRFHAAGLDLSIAGTRQQLGRQRLVASGPAKFVGTWPYVPMDDTDSAFDQGAPDVFKEVGPAEEEAEDSGEVG
jgi:hypothetical protein